MPAKSVNHKTVTQLCNKLRRNHSETFSSIRPILREWRDSQDLEFCLSQFKELLADKREVLLMINNLLEQEVKIKIPVSQNINLEEMSGEIIKRISKQRNRIYVNFLANLKEEKKDNQESVKSFILEHFEDLPQIYAYICNYINGHSALTNKTHEPIREESPRPPPVRDEIQYFNSLSDTMTKQQFEFIIKLLHLYYNCIMSKHDILAMISPQLFQKIWDYEFFKQIINATQISRRKSTPFFKPLNDIDFSKSLRATYSYVKMPEMYPIKCQGKQKNPFLKTVLNDKWVSVPAGSQHETFNIMPKNTFEEALIKNQDEQYEVDILLARIKRIQALLECITGQRTPDPRHRVWQGSKYVCNIDSAMMEVAELSILQIFYKNVYKDDKTNIEILLKQHPVDMSEILLHRLIKKFEEFDSIKKNQGWSRWREIAEKNFRKSLDRKGIEFKKTDKQLTKDQILLKDLQLTLNQKIQTSSYFSTTIHTNLVIFNSFKGLSATVRCSHEPPSDISQLRKLESQAKGEQLPVFIMAFDKAQCCATTYKMLMFSLEYSFNGNPNEKKKTRIFVNEFLSNYMGWSYPKQNTEDIPEVKAPIPDEEKSHMVFESEQDLQIYPVQTSDSKVLYCSTKVYFMLRMLYLVFERFYKASQLLEWDEKRIQQFHDCIEQSIRSKEAANKIQDSLRSIFEENGYLFSTILKNIDLTLKYFNACASDNFTIAAWQLYLTNLPEQTRQDLYFFKTNKLMLDLSGGKYLIRLMFRENYLYLNCFNSMYQNWEVEQQNLKDKEKQRENNIKSISKRLQDYIMKSRDHDRRRKDDRLFAGFFQNVRKRTDSSDIVCRNQLEYRSAPNSIHLCLGQSADGLVKRSRGKMSVKSELKRAEQFMQLIDDL